MSGWTVVRIGSMISCVGLVGILHGEIRGYLQKGLRRSSKYVSECKSEGRTKLFITLDGSLGSLIVKVVITT